jgi:hypothetical protein
MDTELKKLGEEAMGPCACCQRQLLETEFPLFLRIGMKRCGIDAVEVRRHAAFAISMAPRDSGRAGLALARVLGPKVEPVVVVDDWPEVNVCRRCSEKHSLDELMLRIMAQEEEARERSAGSRA